MGAGAAAGGPPHSEVVLAACLKFIALFRAQLTAGELAGLLPLLVPLLCVQGWVRVRAAPKPHRV